MERSRLTFPASANGDRTSLRAAIYDELKELILRGELAPNERLSPQELASRFGCSTMPVREALRLLGEEGLVDVVPRKWTRVAAIEPELLDQIYPLLAVLEQHAVATAPRIPVSSLTRAQQANTEFAEAAAAGDVVGCSAADYQFHEILCELSENATLRRLIAGLKARIRLLEGAYYRSDDAAESVRQHAEILDALAAEDRERAGEVVAENWRMGHRKLRSALTGSGSSGAG
jgi:DNA-binding GntR family transcriptional regulator